MTILTIGNKEVEVSDDFLNLSPEQQNATVEEIAQSLGVTGDQAGSDTGEEPELTAGRAAGLAGRAGVQAIPGAIAGLPALAYDGTIGFLQNMGTHLVNVKRRALGEEEAPYRDPFATTQAVSALGEAGADALGLPKPETDNERIAVAGGQTALEALSGAGLAKLGAKTVEGGTRRVLTELADAPFTQGAIGGLAGAGAQTAVENDVNPLIGTGAGLALGITGAAVPALARQGYRSATNALDQALLRSPEAREQAARTRIYDAASDPDAALRELDEGAGAELVPGSKPTTFQSTGDMGLGSLERELQTANPERFAERRGAENSSRLESLRSVQGDGNAEEIASFLRGQLDEIDSITAGYETKARAAAEDAAGRLRPSEDADAVGRSLRGDMQDAEELARQREASLWNAVDPDGTLTAPIQGAKQKVASIYDSLSDAARLKVSRDEKAITDLIRDKPGVVSLREMMDLQSVIKETMREELSRKGSTRTYARLTQLQQVLRSAMERSAAERIASDPATNGRFQALVNEFQAGSAQGIGSGNRAAGALRAGSVSGMGGEASAQGRGPGSFAGSSRVQGSAQQGRGLSLTQFIAKNGGLPLDAESTARDWGNVSVGRFGKLARPEGRSVDGYWRNKLIEEGYLSRDADGYSSRDITKELYDAIENERAGRKTHTASDEMRSSLFEPDGQEADFLAASRQLREELQNVGVRPEEMSARAFNDAVERIARGEETDAITAYERAVMSLEDEGPVKAAYAPREGSSAGSLLDGYKDDPEVGKRYRAATEATRDKHKTFRQGYVAPMLRREGEKGSFRMADGSVAKNAFMPGPTGGERIKALVKAGAKMSDVAEAAALSLQKANVFKADGTIDAAKLQRWRSSHADALRELPQDARAKFANASLASQTLEQVAALRKQRLDGYNKSVLGKLAKVDTADLPGAIGRILNSSDANRQMGQLVTAANKDKNAKEGLRRAVAEYIQDRFISNKEVGASGENGIRADAFQSFVKSKKGALTLVFGQEHVLRLQAIADDLKRAERSLQAVRVPGNSNTAADVGAALEKATKEAGKSSLVTQMLIAGGAGFMAGGPKGAALGAGGAWAKELAGSMRAAGLKKVDDLVLEMMLDPQLAKVALMKAPITSKGAQKVLADTLARRSVLAGAAAVGGPYGQ
ncbi:hypothetical protein [Microvirga lotononidis]|uniref:Uncharacterized protein n=1 Tax=Microvirga lotononidis TaxID=864069 RepID=I4YRQ7_9HYPH|nr:hypothetical protein [Microvirga lotononidis]EIM26649.1 hypothetical protein MicloDRAFT_00031980 [Microvirga lotononidis]